MNFDELREAWNHEAVVPPTLPGLPPEETRSAIARLRRNMRTEFWFTMAGNAVTLIYILAFARHKPSLMLVLTTTIFVAQTGYFFGRFVLFYRRSARYDMSLRKNLRRFTYELELNMEIYKTYNICVIPLIGILWISILDATGWSRLFQGIACADIRLSTRALIWASATILISMFVAAFFTHWHLRTKYGVHLYRLKKLVDELDEE